MIVSTSRIPAVTAVNAWVRCVSCQHVINGNPYWSIRKSAQLHENVCKSIGYQLSPMLATIRKGY